jgi:hypothetical protein
MQPRVHAALAASLLTGLALGLAPAQPVPQPFPKPGSPTRPSPPAGREQPHPPPPPGAEAPGGAPERGTPTEATLGVPVYPGAQFLASYDAGKGQRFYLFGTNASFAEIVAYYRTLLKQRGELVFDAPATHMFDIGRFREQTMAFPPSVTVKDYTWNGSPGYLNPDPGKGPQRFRTVIQIVPPPASAR